MSDYDEQSDNDDYYNEDNEDNNDNLEEEDNNKNNSAHKNIPNEKIIEFIGSVNGKAGWIKCLYCERFHPNSMHLTGMDYCGHCWGFLNNIQLDLEKGIYTGPNPISEIKNYLKDTFKLHDPTKCTTKECLYNKIIDFEKNKKLHIDFCIELGFVKKEEILIKENNLTSQNSKYSSNSKISNKTNTRINYKLSHITI